MGLSDFLDGLATATPATVATHRPQDASCVATVATVAVADAPELAVTAPSATPGQAAELFALLEVFGAEWSAEDKAEALEVAFADPVDALTCFRMLAADFSTSTRARAREPGPYTSALLAERDPDDDRRTCSDCANLTPREGRCLAAWRGERPNAVARREYHPITDALLRCDRYAPGPNDPDRRGGAERWPLVAEHMRRVREEHRGG